jgi:hypothetical protein
MFHLVSYSLFATAVPNRSRRAKGNTPGSPVLSFTLSGGIGTLRNKIPVYYHVMECDYRRGLDLLTTYRP